MSASRTALTTTRHAPALLRLSTFAQAERASAASRTAAADPYNASVSQVLCGRGTNFASVPESLAVMDAVRIMNKRNIGSLIVLGEDGTRGHLPSSTKAEPLRGIVTERDVLLACPRLVEGHADKICVADIMSRDLRTVDATATVGESMAIMIDMHIRHLPVLDDGELVGVLSIRDLVERITKDHEQEVMNLNLQLGRLASVLGDQLGDDLSSSSNHVVRKKSAQPDGKSS